MSQQINAPRFKYDQVVYNKSDEDAYEYTVQDISYTADGRWHYSLKSAWSSESWFFEDELSFKPTPVEKRVDLWYKKYLEILPQKEGDKWWLARRFELRVDEFEFLLQKAGYNVTTN